VWRSSATRGSAGFAMSLDDSRCLRLSSSVLKSELSRASENPA